jgi:hypothetical protein
MNAVAPFLDEESPRPQCSTPWIDRLLGVNAFLTTVISTFGKIAYARTD